METNKLSWQSVRSVVADRPRCLVSNECLSEASPDGSEYFHITSFTSRPGEKAKRTSGVFDNYLRNTGSRQFKLCRGKDRINK